MATMRVTSKSPMQVAKQAVEVANRCLPPYSAKHSPKKFTQHQLFAIAVLRQFFRVDYRGITAILGDCDLATHLWIGFHVCKGPCVDSPQFKPAVRQATQNQPIDEPLGDKGYDAEHNHRLCREELGVSSTVIAVRRNTNGTRQWPTTPYRRQMKSVAARAGYGQRWQVESGFSHHKRLLGSSLRARTWPMQNGNVAFAP